MVAVRPQRRRAAQTLLESSAASSTPGAADNAGMLSAGWSGAGVKSPHTMPGATQARAQLGERHLASNGT